VLPDGVMVPPVTDADMLEPVAELPTALFTPIPAVLENVLDSVTAMVATMPSGIAVWFNPTARHVYEPELPAHVIVLPLDWSAGPAAAVRAVMAEDG
jgi:hypothetical protein